jgi:hypothetical protein
MAIPLVEFTSSRFIIIGLYSILALMFVILGIRVRLRGQKTRQTNYISKFFLYVGGSLIVNIAYSPIAVQIIQQIGNNTVILFTTLGVANLLLFTLSVKFSEKELTASKSIMIELLIFAAGIVYYFIPGGTTIQLPDYAPHWSINFVIYCLIVTQILMLGAIFTGIGIAKKMEDKTLRGRFNQFITGLVFNEILLISTILGNGGFLNSTIRLLLTLTIFPGAILIYLGVGRRLHNDS